MLACLTHELSIVQLMPCQVSARQIQKQMWFGKLASLLALSQWGLYELAQAILRECHRQALTKDIFLMLGRLEVFP